MAIPDCFPASPFTTLADMLGGGRRLGCKRSTALSSSPRTPRIATLIFATGLFFKDVRMCVNEAEAMGVPMVVGAVVQQMLAVTNAKYGPNSDFTSICRVVEGWGGVEVRA
ncbi:NAD-binding protein [Devosia faecipullorum]|uniref:NAD-binding protein n=1 Tax=Devosia faecipullorum TaxID=2755039 RepID=UPI002ED9E844